MAEPRGRVRERDKETRRELTTTRVQQDISEQKGTTFMKDSLRQLELDG